MRKAWERVYRGLFIVLWQKLWRGTNEQTNKTFYFTDGNEMTKRELVEFCLTLPEAYEGYPFDGTAHSDDGSWAVMRHDTNKKGFAHIYERNGKICVNLKCDPHKADFLRGAFVDVTPGWHMNKTHWNTVCIGGDVPPEEIYDMIRDSYDLIKPKRQKR
jgi:predicted DNA-binding protein (MmcQ/YjbR family)